MPIRLNDENGGKILVVHVSWSWAKADSASFVPEFEWFAMAGDKSGEDLPEIRNWKSGA